MTYFFDLASFCVDCERSVKEFRREEKKLRPENALLLLTQRQISAQFNQPLTEIKREMGFVPDEVYLSVFSDGRMSVNLGATLRDLEVVFRLSLDVRALSRKCKKEGYFFSFEHEVVKEYNRCVNFYKYLSEELKGAWKARDVEVGELMRAVQITEEAHDRAFAKLVSFNQNHFSKESKKQAAAELANLHVLLTKLRRITSTRR